MAALIEEPDLRLMVLALFLTGVVSAATSVWIDTDPSALPGGHEVDDAFALLQAFGSPEISVKGVSIVFGNADLTTAGIVGRRIAREFGPPSLQVFDGARSASELGLETKGARALAKALRQGRLTILALGPATNVATVVKNYPDLARNIDEIIAVAGRRPNQHFVAGPRQKVPFRDLNFELDPEAFRILLASKVRLTLTPWEISSRVWLLPGDIADLARRSPKFDSLLPAVRDWLAVWRNDFGAPGFNPFDSLAVGYLVDRKDFTCTAMSANIEPGADDAAPAPGANKPYLMVRPKGMNKTVVQYCATAASGFKQDLLERVAASLR